MTFPPQQPPPGYAAGPPQGGYRPLPPQPMGPGGAYGPAEAMPGQPVPGQMPPPSMTMGKPGTVTGIQVILWIFLAIGTVGDVFSIINMVEFFNPFSLIALAYALHTTVQALVTPIHIARGKRWAWIWSLVSAVIGLVFALVGIVFGVVFIDTTPLPLLFGLTFAALNGTLLGLLASKSARRWILVHRLQRGEVQVSGMPGAPGVPGATGPAGPAAAERPASRPGVATFAVVVVWLFAALSAWGVWVNLRAAMLEAEFTGGTFIDGATFGGNELYIAVPLMIYPVLAILAVITAPLLTKGSAGGRIFGVVWSVFAVLAAGLLLTIVVIEYLEWRDFLFPGQPNPFPLRFARHIALLVMAIAIFVLMLVPGVRRWTPSRPPSALIVMVPAGPQQGYPPPQRQYPPRF